MLGPTPATWTVRGATFALWALAAASSAYWALKLGGPTPPAQAPVTARGFATVDAGAIARLLGGTPAAANGGAPAAAPSLASRLQLLGVVAGERSGAGAALIAVDGKPPRPYRLGSAIEEGVVLQSVHGRTAVLGATRTGAPLLTLELPRPTPGQPSGPVPVRPAPSPDAGDDAAPPPPAIPAPRMQLPPGSMVPGRLPSQPPPITMPR